MIKVEVITATIRTLEVGVTLDIPEIKVNIVEVIEGISRIETGHKTETEAGIEMVAED